MRAIPTFLVVLLANFLATGLAQEVSEGSEPSSTLLSRSRPLDVSSPGPWGQLESYQFPLSIPDEYFPLIRIPSQKTEWRLPAETFKELHDLILASGLSEPETKAVLDGAKILKDEKTARVFPTNEAILAMEPVTRYRLYTALARMERNSFQARPIYLNSQNLSLWFEGSNLPIGAIQDVSELAYPTPSGRGFFLSDLPVTLRHARNTREERVIMQAMLRQPALIVRLRLTGESPVSEIARYWTADYKNKATLPMLESVVTAKGSSSIDITHLLPATPRQNLNRFPEVSDGVNGRFPDWFWTCYNFFRFSPINVYADSPERETILRTEFDWTSPPLQFGDMLLMNSGTKTVHGCIYIADDIVFTKNGADLFSPWIFMRLNDVVAYHNLSGNLAINVFRKRGADAPESGQ